MSRAKLIVLAVGAIALVVVVVGLTSVWARFSGPGLISRTRTHDFGDVVQGESVERVFVVGNDGASDLKIAEVIPWASTVVSVDSVVPARGEAQIRIRLDTRNLKGALNELVKVQFVGRDQLPLWLQLRGRVVLPVQLAPADRAYFFTVVGEAPEEELEIINHQDAPLEILGVTSDNPRFRTTFRTVEAGQRYKLTIALDPMTPSGRHEAKISVRTDSRDYPSLEIEGWARVRDIVSTSISRVDFARIRFDDLDLPVVNRKTVLVAKHRGTDFQVRRATTDVSFLDVEVVPQNPGQSFLIHVKIDDRRARRGEIVGTLVIETNDPAFARLELPITGTIL